MRGNFGPKPKLIKWAYEGIIRPKLTYACLVWGHEIRTKAAKLKLRSLDRLAVKSMTTIARSTPQASLELIVGLLPLELHIQKLGLAAKCRLQDILPPAWVNLNPNRHRFMQPHLQYWNQLGDELEIDHRSVDACGKIVWDKQYKVNTDSFDGHKNI